VVSTTAKAIFDEGFTNAMRDTLWLPIAVMALAAVSILFVKSRPNGTTDAAPAAEAAAEPAADQVAAGTE